MPLLNNRELICDRLIELRLINFYINACYSAGIYIFCYSAYLMVFFVAYVIRELVLHVRSLIISR